MFGKGYEARIVKGQRSASRQYGHEIRNRATNFDTGFLTVTVEISKRFRGPLSN
jgi:hypothetical protein